MFEGRKVIAVTPAGRRRYLHLLVQHLLVQMPILDKFVLWSNTDDVSDKAYMEALAVEFPGFIEVWDSPKKFKAKESTGFTAYNIAPFFTRCVEANTTYVRFDDDIVWMAPDAIQKLLEARHRHPYAPLIYATTINNGIISHLLQRLGKIGMEAGIAEYDAMGANSWTNPFFAEYVHRQAINKIFQGKPEELHICDWILNQNERCSINCISWEGESFARFEGIVGSDEELWLTATLPKVLGASNVICGDSIVSHFAYFPQRPHLDATDLLDQYEKLSPPFSV